MARLLLLLLPLSQSVRRDRTSNSSPLRKFACSTDHNSSREGFFRLLQRQGEHAFVKLCADLLLVDLLESVNDRAK